MNDGAAARRDFVVGWNQTGLGSPSRIGSLPLLDEPLRVGLQSPSVADPPTDGKREAAWLAFCDVPAALVGQTLVMSVGPRSRESNLIRWLDARGYGANPALVATDPAGSQGLAPDPRGRGARRHRAAGPQRARRPQNAGRAPLTILPSDGPRRLPRGRSAGTRGHRRAWRGAGRQSVLARPGEVC